MRKKLAVAVLSILTAFVGVAPAQAFPSIAPSGITAPSAVEHVQWRERRSYGRHRYYDRRYRHRHYRRGPNVGAIIGGLAAGAIIGGALAQPRYVAPPRRYIRTGNAHVSWCYNRYRSYRAYDNTFQPYHGPRRQCYSPYN